MGVVVFTILKTIGVVLICVIGFLLLLAGMILFVPIRYRIDLQKESADWKEVSAKVRITWLCHLLNIRFWYPEYAYVRIRLFLFTVFRSDRPHAPKVRKTSGKASKKKEDSHKETASKEPKSKNTDSKEPVLKEKLPEEKGSKENVSKETKSFFLFKLIRMMKRIWEILRNIRYTIHKIYDKIVHIIKNIRYDLDILKSDLFRETFRKCSGKFFALIKSVMPSGMEGELHIGMEDPAATGQIMEYYGMLYPLIGSRIRVIPDFEQVILNGNIHIRGKITIFKVVQTGIWMYFNKDIRKLIHIWKRRNSNGG